MSIQRYFVWIDEAHEQEDGKFVRLEDIIKLLEFPNGWHETVYVAGEGDEHFASSCVTCLNVALIKGENK